MFDKYSKRNTKSMSNKRNCLKHLFLISLIALIFASCSPSSNRISETASVRIETNQKGISVASVMPTEPTLVKYEVELLQNDDTKYRQFFNPSDSIILEDIKIGTYKLVVTGYSEYTDEENNTPVVEGIKESITIYPDSGDSNRNHFDITLSYLSQGKGAISVKITWDKLTATGNLIDDAIKKGSLGFIALKASDNMPLKGNLTTELTKENIQWADVKSGSMVYEEDGLDANKTGEEIYFRIYSEIDGELVVIAETFSTVLQVYPNLTSVPDTNDKYNFSLSNDNIIGYLRNVTNAKAEAASDTSLKITWTNPKFSDSIYPITVTVTAKSNQFGTEIKADPITYNSATDAEGTGETTIKGLSSSEVYSIYFQIKGKVGYSANTAMISDARPRIPVSKISFDTTDMDSFRFVEGTKNKEIKAVIEPEDATVQTFSVTEKNDNENVVINGHNVTFNKAGAYTLVITSDDATAAPAEQQVIVYLPTPSKPEVSKSDSGIHLSWNEVTNASGYKITRESNKGETKEFKSPTNSFDDITVATGNNYTYKVKATLNDDSQFDSDYSESSVAVNIDKADIEITIEDFPSEDFSSIFDEYDGTIINSKNPELTINLTQSIEGATKYKWVLDKNTVIAEGTFDEANKIVLSSSTAPELNDEYESSHSLTLYIMIDEIEYSGTLRFFYSDPEAATNVEITGIHTEDDNNRIIYGTPETFVADFNDNISGKVRWSSSDEDILYIDPTSGIAEAKTKGFVRITATLVSDESKSFSIENVESYIPIESIKISNPSNERIIVSRTGVTVSEDYSSAKFTVEVFGPNSLEPTLGINEVTPIFDEDLVDVKYSSSNWIITPKVAGNPEIYVKADNVDSNSISLTVHDFRIYYESLENDATGKNIVVDGKTVGGKSHALFVRTLNEKETNDELNSVFSTKWCFGPENGGALNNTTKYGVNGGTAFSITGNKWDGSVNRQLQRAECNAGIIISDATNQEVAQVFFFAESGKIDGWDI